MLPKLSISLLPILMLLGLGYLRAESTAPGSAAPAPLSQAAQVPVETLIRENFGPNIEVVKDPEPTLLKGDFNGDGIGDLAILVRPKGTRGELLPGVLLVQTTEGARDPQPAEMLNGKNSLAVILGSASGWKTPKPSGKFLIYAFGWIGWKGPENGQLVVLPKSQQKRNKKGYVTLAPNNLVHLPVDGRGDLIVVPTEGGINTILYWNGKTYRFWLAPGETS